jgi:hypothetical protein
VRLAAALACLGCASAAFGEEASPEASVEQGRELYMEADFEAAGAAFSAVLDSPGLDRADATEAHRYLAAIALIVGDGHRVAEHARAAVALTPSVEAPEGAPPELSEALDEARAELGEEGVTLGISSDPEVLEPGATAEVTARLEPSPAGLVDAVRLRCGGEAVPEIDASGPPPEVSVTVAPGAGAASVRCSAEAETSAGAALFEVEATLPVRGGRGGGGSDGGVLWWP